MGLQQPEASGQNFENKTVDMQSNWGNAQSHLGWLAMVAAGLTVLAVSSIFFGIEFTDSGFVQASAGQSIRAGRFTRISTMSATLSPFIWQAVFFTGLTEGLEVLFRSLVTLEKGLTIFHQFHLPTIWPPET